MLEIVQGVYKLSGLWDQADLGAGVYLIEAEGELTLVDTGYRNRSRQVLKRIYGLGFSPTRISNIIITHHHPDHTGGLADLKAITGATVIAHTADAPYIEGRLPQPGPFRPAWLCRMTDSFRKMLNTEPVKVDIQVSDGDELPVAGGIKIIHTPGHTPGSICIYLKHRRLMFVGDLVARRLALKLPSMAFTADIPQELESIKKLAGLQFDVMCFGHGYPVRSGADRLLQEFARKLA